MSCRAFVCPCLPDLQSLQALVVEVQAKTGALLEAERRFSELEALMQRMMARSGLGLGVAQQPQ